MGSENRGERAGLGYRISTGVIGAVLGAIYGGVFGILLSGGFEHFNFKFLTHAAAVFGVLSFLAGPFLADIVGAVIHFLLGLAALMTPIEWHATTGNVPVDPKSAIKGLLWLAIGTGILLYVVRH